MTSTAVRGYRTARRLASGLSGLVEAVFVGAALGLMGREELHELDELSYGVESGYRTAGYNAQGLWPWERRCVDEAFPAGATVAVLGAGAGRQVLALSRAGFEVVGFECHPGLREAGAELLQDAGVAASLLPMERDRCPKLPSAVDAVMAGWGVYSSIQGRAVRVAFLGEAARQVSPGTPLVLSFLTRPRGARRHRVAAAVARPLRALLRRAPVEPGDYLRRTWSHEFTEAEVRDELVRAGWAALHYGEHPYGHVLAERAP